MRTLIRDALLPLPAAVIAEIAAKYQEALWRLAGEPAGTPCTGFPRSACRSGHAQQGSGPLRSRPGGPLVSDNRRHPNEHSGTHRRTGYATEAASMSPAGPNTRAH